MMFHVMFLSMRNVFRSKIENPNAERVMTGDPHQLLLMSWMKKVLWCSSKRYWFRTSRVRLMRVSSSEKGHCTSSQVSPVLLASREQLMMLEFLQEDLLVS